MKLKQILKNSYIKYSISFLLCVSLILFIFVIRGVSLIGDADSYNQTFPVFVYIGKYIRSILQGEFKTFDFQIGYGEDIISILNYYGFGDLLSVLAAFCPVDYAEIAYNFTMVFKLYLCGIAFLIYAKRYIKSDNVIVSGALLYSLSTYVLFRGMVFWMFINPIFIYPLILSGIDEICLENKRISYLLIFSVFWQALNGFYFLYINVILTVIYYVVIVLCSKDIHASNLNFFIKKGIAILGQSLLGVGVASVIFIPGIIGYFNSSRTERSRIFERIQDFFVYDGDFYLNNLKGLLIPNVWESVITMPVMIVLACIVAIMSKKCAVQFKVLAIVFVLLYNIPLWGSIMNGFSEVSDRWFYAVILFVTLLGCMGIEAERKFPKRIEIPFLVIFFAIICADIVYNGMQVQIVCRDIILYVCALISLYVYVCEYREKLLLPWVCVLLVCNGTLVMGPNDFGGNGHSWGFVPSGKVLKDMDRSIEKIEAITNDEFARIDIYDKTSLGTSLVKGYNGTSEYFSISNRYISDFYQELAISPGLRSASWILKGIDGREELMSMLSVCQYTDFITSEEQHISEIRTNKLFLPLGYTYDQWIMRDEFNRLNPLQKQKAMLEGVVLEKKYQIESKLSCDKMQTKEANYYIEYNNIDVDDSKISTTENSNIRVNMDTNEDTAYVCIKDFIVYDKGVHEIYVGNKNLQLRDQNDGYYMGINEFWINVTELKEENGIKYFDIMFLENCEFSIPKIEIYEHNITEGIVEARKEDVLENIRWENNQLKGNIELGMSKFLFMSIPYSSGWKAYIDGVETEIHRANIAFSAVVVPKGEHEICFIYGTPGIKIGILCSLLSILIIICLRKEFNIRKNKHNFA